jgi:triphosphoribosyl-dephospho-CoA synthase
MASESLAEYAMLACWLEATARKPGNVHPLASFADLTYSDFIRSARASAPSFARGGEWGVGRVVLDAVERTHRVLARNTNLGIALLLAPLARVPAGVSLEKGIADVLSHTTREDAELVYAAIRLANPGGLGRVEREDVTEAPSVTLVEAMRLAADRDSLARQYVTNFATVFAGARRLASSGHFADRWEEAVVDLHLWLMAELPDTLIARKCGWETARESADRASAVLEAGWPEGEVACQLFTELDAWLRADGHRRNPGTTADLVAACLFAAFRDHLVAVPRN